MHNFRQTQFVLLLAGFLLMTHSIKAATSDSLLNNAIQLLKVDIDSSLQTFQGSLLNKDDSIKLRLYDDYIGELLYMGELQHLEDLFESSIKTTFDHKSFRYYGSILDHKSEYFKMQSKFDSCILIAEELYNQAELYVYSDYQISALLEMGGAYESLGFYPKALDAYFKALSIAEKDNDKQRIGSCYQSLATLYNTIYQSADAIEYHKKALEIFEELNDQPNLARSYNNLGLVLDRYKKYDSARIYFEKGLKVAKNLGNEFGVAITTMNLGLNSYRLKDYETALKLFDKSFLFFDKVGDAYGKTLCYYNYCRIYFDQGNLEIAADYGYKCYDLAKSSRFQNEIMDASEYISKIAEKQGDYEQSLRFFKEATAVKDSLYSEQKNQEIGRLESKNELQQAQLQNEILLKDQEIQSKQLRRTYLIIVIVSLLLIGVAFSLFLYYRTNRKLRLTSLTVKRQADRLKELDAYKSRFFANISHDLRTPISLISGYLKELQEDDESYFTQKSSATITKGLKNVDRLIYLTEEIRDLILLEEGNLKLEYRRVKINKYLGFLIELFRSHAESSGLVLEYESDIEEEVVALDPNQFEKIIYNLVANSIKFTGEGSVAIKLSLVSSKIVITISDTGRGISQEEQSKIFDRFYQLPNQEYQAKEGMGIGLFLVKELVELHNGTIKIESTQEVGSTFKIELPVNKEIVAEFYDPTISSYITDRNKLQEDNSQPIQQGTIYEGRSTILVVDDHPEVRDYIGNQLRDEYNILFASNGIQALELLDKMNVNLVITDLMMPLMDGFELLKNIKNKYRMLPAMVVSARSTIKDTTEILGYGINDFISKPFDKDNFLLRVKNLISITRNKIDLPFSEKDHLKLANNRALTQLHQLIETNMSESKVAINEIADKLCLSERQASRVIKSLTGKAPGEYVKDYKLVYAESLLKGKEISSASELAKMVGYTNVTHFNQAFEKRFGYRPSEIIKEN